MENECKEWIVTEEEEDDVNDEQWRNMREQEKKKMMIRKENFVLRMKIHIQDEGGRIMKRKPSSSSPLLLF